MVYMDLKNKIASYSVLMYIYVFMYRSGRFSYTLQVIFTSHTLHVTENMSSTFRFSVFSEYQLRKRNLLMKYAQTLSRH
jgi:hypothetical protein